MAEIRSAAAVWSTRLAVIAVIAFVAGPVLAHFGIVSPLTGFTLFAVGGLLGVLTLVIAIIAAVRAGAAAASVGLVLGIAITLAFLIIAAPGRKHPRINDITTDTSHPPVFVKAGSLPGNQGRDMNYPGTTFADQQRQGYPDLGPLHLPVPPNQAFERVKTTAQQMPVWQITRIDPTAHALEGVATSRLFRFHDDFVIEVRDGGDGTSMVEMRSKSRDGKGDIGANAARINTFFARLRRSNSD